MTISARRIEDPKHETELVLAAVPENFDPAHRERLEEAIAETRAAVARLERAIAAAALPALPVTAEAAA
jgi:hypothetical protein